MVAGNGRDWGAELAEQGERIDGLEGRVVLVEEEAKWQTERVIKPIQTLAAHVQERVEVLSELAAGIAARTEAINDDRIKDFELIAQLHDDVRLVMAGARHREKLPSLSEYEPTVNPDGSASLPPGAFHSIRENVAKQNAALEAKGREIVAKQHALDVAEAARAATERATDKVLTQVRADRDQKLAEQKRESDERFDTIKKWLTIVGIAGPLLGGGIMFALHVWGVLHH